MNKNTRGIFCTLLGGTLWGLSGACGEYLFTNYQVDSAWLTVMRMSCAGVVLMAFSLLRLRGKVMDIWKVKRDAFQLVLFALLGLMFSQYAYLTSINYANAGTATVLQYVGPVLVMAYVCLRGRRKPNFREGICIVLAVGGTYLLATHGNPNTMVLSKEGLFWGILSAISLAFYTLIPAKIIPKWGSILVTGWSMLLGGIVMGSLIQVWTIPVALDAKGWLAAGGVIILGTVFAYTLYLQGVSDCGAVRASMLASVEPLTATLLSVIWLGNNFMWIDLVGFVCIIATVFLLAKKEE